MLDYKNSGLVKRMNTILKSFHSFFSDVGKMKYDTKKKFGVNSFFYKTVIKSLRLMKRFKIVVVKSNGSIAYFATSRYHILCCMVHREKYFKDKSAILFLSDWKKEYLEQLETYGGFEQVHLIYDALFRSKIERKYKNFSDLDFEKRENCLDDFVNEFESLLPTELQHNKLYQFERIIMCNDMFGMGIYLSEKDVSYDLIEDANGVFSDNAALINDIKNNSTGIERFFLDKYDILNHNVLVNRIFVNYQAQTKKFNKHRTVDFCVKRELALLSPNKKADILKMFHIEYIPTETDHKATLLLTYPLSKRYSITEKMQYEIYTQLIDILLPDNQDLHIKPHPDDTLEYSDIFSDATIIDKNILAELLYYKTHTTYDKVISVVSTSFHSIEKYGMSVQIGKDIVFNSGNIIHYYAAFALLNELQPDTRFVFSYKNVFIDLFEVISKFSNIVKSDKTNKKDKIHIADYSKIAFEYRQIKQFDNNDMVIILNAKNSTERYGYNFMATFQVTKSQISEQSYAELKDEYIGVLSKREIPDAVINLMLNYSGIEIKINRTLVNCENRLQA